MYQTLLPFATVRSSVFCRKVLSCIRVVVPGLTVKSSGCPFIERTRCTALEDRSGFRLSLLGLYLF